MRGTALPPQGRRYPSLQEFIYSDPFFPTPPDFYGSGVVYHGTVAGFSAGTGSAFAMLPAQNATGNWIKVVQRVPVRIQLDAKELEEHPLRVGLSMQADIDLRDEGAGAPLAESH